jgi:transcriptional regulator with XRE-family HTH domain
MTPRSDYEKFESSSPENRRLLREEELIVGVAETIWREMERQGVSRAALAERLGNTPGYVTQILSGSRNLTLRTLADVADALNFRVRFKVCRNESKTEETAHFIVPQSMRWTEMANLLTFCSAEEPQLNFPDPPGAQNESAQTSEQGLAA